MDQCLECYKGFYLSNDEKKQCIKCDIDNCKECEGNAADKKCSKCLEGYILSGKKCLKPCEINENSQCKICNNEEEKIDQCLECNKGFYLPKDNNSYCEKCDIDNCKECEGNTTYTKCSICEGDYILSGNKCLKPCETNENSQCKKCNNEEEKIDQCLECYKGFYLPKDNNTYCEKCSIKNCEICENNNCTKCFDNFLTKYENSVIISCFTETPDRIDIIKNGNLTEGVIEILTASGTIKTQLSNGIKYYFEGSGSAPSTSYWWKDLSGNDVMHVSFNISRLLPSNTYYLKDNYYLYLKGSYKYEASIGGGSIELWAKQTFFYVEGREWGCNWMNCFNSMQFGTYTNLETVKHNGNIYIGGVYNRGKVDGYHYLSLDGFNYTTVVGNGTGNIGWSFGVSIGTYSSRTVYVRYTFIINDLFLVRKKD